MTKMSIDEFKAQLDLEFFLDRESLPYRLTRGVSGDQLNIKCCPNPDCRDDRWRTYFGIETGQGNCFKCGKGFNSLSFIHKYFEHQNWRDTFSVLDEVLREQGWRPKREAVAAVTHDNVEMPTSRALPLEDGSSLQYLEDRGFGVEIVKYMGLRWCEFGWWKFKDAEGAMQMQNFANRVIIPVFDLDGDLKTFQGRDLLGTSDRKYLFPKELPGTGRYLLNGQNVLATDHVLMVEGAFDLAAAKIALDEEVGLRHVVTIGSFGKHLSYGSMTGDDQLGRLHKLKLRGVKYVTIMWDGEPAALIAALDAAKLISGIGLIPRIALLPAGKDPNEVPAAVVRAAFHKAVVWTPMQDIKWRLRNPFAV